MTPDTPMTLKGQALWGCKAIANFLDTPQDKVAKLREMGAPIGKVGGQLFALRSDLLTWLQGQIAQDRQG